MSSSEAFKICVVLPCYNEEANVAAVYERLSAVLADFPEADVLFVDDGSTDRTLEEIKKLRTRSQRVKYLSFSRNFGHQNALRAGLEHADGDCVITMDADLQHPPELIPELISKWRQGYQVVGTVRRENENVSLLKRKTANLYYDLLNALSDIHIQRGAADFRLLDRSVVDILKSFQERDIFFRGVIPWLGFSQCSVTYAPNPRHAGKTHYSLKKMLGLALDGITSFSVRPLRLSTLMGFVISGLTFCYCSYAILMRLLTDRAVSGWASLMTGVFFIGGVQLIVLGILGEYIGRLFIEAKGRPKYIVKEKAL